MTRLKLTETQQLAQFQTETIDRDTFLPSIGMGELMRDTGIKLLRNWRILALCLTVAVLGSVYYVLTATPLYTANGSLLIDPRVGQVLDNRQQPSPAIGSLDALTVDSELRVLTSREVTGRAVQALGLGQSARGEDETLAGPTLRERLTALFGLDPAPPPGAGLPDAQKAARADEALRRVFVRQLDARRAGDSYVIDISYTSPDLAFAAEAVNTLMREYLSASSEQQVAQIGRTRDWLSERIAALEVSLREAETAVAEFRGENELVALQGELLPSEVALNAAIEDLISLRRDALILEVQVQQLQEQIEAGNIDAIQIAGEERSSALEEFQARYAELLREEQELLISWTDEAPVVQAVRRQQEQIRSLILGEYRQFRDRLATRAEALARAGSAPPSR